MLCGICGFCVQSKRRSPLASVDRLFGIGENRSCVNKKHFQSSRVSAAGDRPWFSISRDSNIELDSCTSRNLSKQEAVKFERILKYKYTLGRIFLRLILFGIN